MQGHQRFDSLVPGDGGRIAVVTAGWEEREDEDAELLDHLSRPAVNLGLYRRAGFVEVARRKGYYGEREDAILMELELEALEP